MLSAAMLTELLNLVPASQHYLALMSTDPLTVADPLTVEVTSPTYARLKTMALVGTQLRNANSHWLALPKGTVVEAVAAFDDSVNGNFLYAWRVGPHSFPRGGSYRVAAGGLVLNVPSF